MQPTLSAQDVRALERIGRARNVSLERALKQVIAAAAEDERLLEATKARPARAVKLTTRQAIKLASEAVQEVRCACNQL
jgi:regulator of extracellular matrix RemA (YlzA/DUF370 family)